MSELQSHGQQADRIASAQSLAGDIANHNVYDSFATTTLADGRSYLTAAYKPAYDAYAYAIPVSKIEYTALRVGGVPELGLYTGGSISSCDFGLDRDTLGQLSDKSMTGKKLVGTLGICYGSGSNQ